MGIRIAALPTIVAVLLGAGCSTESEWTYNKPGVSPTRFDQDHAQCLREADRPQNMGMSRAQRADQELLKRCMERKGYQVKRAE
ncbi:MAG: hypothetical protein ACREGL_09170 [Alphaproteobacteria bacterium]